MKKIIRFSVTVIVACFATQFTYGQFSLNGEIRPRMEYRHGYSTLADSGQAAAAFVNQRTRLNFGYHAEGFNVKVSLQDVRIWGNQKQLIGNEDYATSIHEAWAEALITEKLSFKFGRQEITYDDHRIFGNVDWAQQARSHDAAIIKFKEEGLMVDLGFAYNQDIEGLKGTKAFNSSYKSFQYLWLHKDFSEKFGLSFLLLNNGVQANYVNKDNEPTYQDNYSQTIGPRITYKTEKMEVNGVFYFQTGKTNDFPAKDVSAYLAGLDLSYKMSEKLTTTVGFELQSGNVDSIGVVSQMSEQNAFSPLYGTNHGFNGHMDYFYVGGNHANSVGLQDIFLKLKYAPEKYNIGLDVHFFSSAEDILKMDSKTGKYGYMSRGFGTEIDLNLGFNLSEGVALKSGYSQMFATETLETLRGGNIESPQNWFYTMLVVKPDFIKKETSKPSIE